MKITLTPNNDYRWKWDVVLYPTPTDEIAREISKWCNNTYGPGGRYARWTWYMSDLIMFVNEEDAVMFQLAWS